MPSPMIDPVAATVAAVIAAQLMEAPAYLQRALGLPVHQDIFDEGGSILRAPAPWRRLAGWVGHSVLAVAIVLLYAMFFATVADNDNLAWWGILAGTVHGLLGGVVIGAFVDVHPRMPGLVPAPGVSTATTADAMSSRSSSVTSGSDWSPVLSMRSYTPSCHPQPPSDPPLAHVRAGSVLRFST